MPTKSLLENPKPGQFKARCTLRSRIPWDKMTDEIWTIANERGYTREFREMASGRVDPETRRKGRWEVVFPCPGFETTDRAAFAEHMLTVHGRKPSGRAQLRPPKVGRWTGQPKLTEDGKPWADGDDDTETCACGLVLELGSSEASRQHVREHLARCVERQVA